MRDFLLNTEKSNCDLNFLDLYSSLQIYSFHCKEFFYKFMDVIDQVASQLSLMNKTVYYYEDRLKKLINLQYCFHLYI